METKKMVSVLRICQSVSVFRILAKPGLKPSKKTDRPHARGGQAWKSQGRAAPFPAGTAAGGPARKHEMGTVTRDLSIRRLCFVVFACGHAHWVTGWRGPFSPSANRIMAEIGHAGQPSMDWMDSMG